MDYLSCLIKLPNVTSGILIDLCPFSHNVFCDYIVDITIHPCDVDVYKVKQQSFLQIYRDKQNTQYSGLCL